MRKLKKKGEKLLQGQIPLVAEPYCSPELFPLHPLLLLEEKMGNQLLVRRIPMMPDHQAVSQGWQKKPKMQEVWAAWLKVKASLCCGKRDGHLLKGEEKAFLALETNVSTPSFKLSS